MDVIKISKYIRFELIEKKAKTNIYSIINISGNYSLGEIKWYSAWRQYCLIPYEDTIWNTDCLKEVENFIRKLMNDRRKKL